MICSSSSCCRFSYQTPGIVRFLDSFQKPRHFPGHRSIERLNLVRSQVKSSSLDGIHRCLSLNKREIGINSPCTKCQAKGAILCGTCSGSGLYVDSILESQGIIVKVKCLGCGGSGNVMCSACFGRGHTGL